MKESNLGAFLQNYVNISFTSSAAQMFDFEREIARELSSHNIHWCYKLMLLQILYLLQVYSVQQIKIEQHYELCIDNNQLLFCLVSLLNNIMTNAFLFEVSVILPCTLP